MQYVAFLRAINVVNRRLKMDTLQALYVEMGFEDVGTYIASGNVIFESHSPPLVHDLESRFNSRYGFASQVFVRTAAQVHEILAVNPWPQDLSLVDVSFLEGVPDQPAARMLEDAVKAPESLVVVGSEVFFLREKRGKPTVHNESATGAGLGMATTRRGMPTIDKIATRLLT